jgi:hypothetical protein
LATNDDLMSLTVGEVEAITGSISRLSTRVSEVEGMKFEMQFLRTRLRRLEVEHMESVGRVEPVQRNTVDERRCENPPLFYESSTSISRKNKRENDDVGSLDDDHTSGATVPSWKRVRYSQDDSLTRRTPLPGPDEVNGENSHDMIHEQNERYSPKPPHGNQQEPRIHDYCPVESQPLAIGNCASAPKTVSISSQHEPGRKTRSRRRRGRGGSMRDADGVLITKSGKPDKRAGNYKYLQA